MVIDAFTVVLAVGAVLICRKESRQYLWAESINTLSFCLSLTKYLHLIVISVDLRCAHFSSSQFFNCNQLKENQTVKHRCKRTSNDPPPLHKKTMQHKRFWILNKRIISYIKLSDWLSAFMCVFLGCFSWWYNNGDWTRPAREEWVFAGSLRELSQLSGLQKLLWLRSARGSYLVGTQGTVTILHGSFCFIF